MSISSFRLDAGRIIPLKTNATSPDELSRELPRGLYTTFSTNHNGTRVLGLKAHLDRLYIPAQYDGFLPSASRSDLRLALSKLAMDCAPRESRFRLLLSTSNGQLYVILQPFPPIPREIYDNGVKVITADLVRQDPRRKDTGFINASRLERSKVDGNVYEILLTKKGQIYEGMTSNFYAVIYSAVQGGKSGQESGATLVTARHGILLGVTRRIVLRLARGWGMSIIYRSPRLDEPFREACITSSSRGVVPVVSIDGKIVGEGTVGSWTRRLERTYHSYVEEHSETIKPSP